MENDNKIDFTFCQVGAPKNQDGFRTQETVPDIGNIKIDGEGDTCGTGEQVTSSGSLSNDRYPLNTSKQEKRVGSLTFNVIDATSQRQASQLPRQAVSEGAGGSVKASLEQKNMTRKPKARTKVPFEKGYSQMDWFKLTRTHPDLAGLKGQSNRRLISMSEVKQHQTEDSMWTVLKGRVYNIAPYMKFHPGGIDMLMKAVGKDGTLLFTVDAQEAREFLEDLDHLFSDKYHAWVNFEFLLEKCLVGILDDSQ